MNLYLCSTVRNLLFALLKASGEPGQESHVLVIRDQQKIDPGDYNTGSLPKNVKVHFITRKFVRAYLDRSPYGYIIRLLAALNIRTSRSFRARMQNYLFKHLLKELNIDCGTGTRLFLFNDRNRVARLLRLGFQHYSIIEDGLSNYYGNKLKPLEAVWRKVSFHKMKKRYLGDDARCETIFLLKPELAPDEIKHKVKAIDFIDPDLITGVCYKFFNLDPEEAGRHEDSWIIATQPISVGQLSASGFDLVIYERMIAHLKTNNIDAILKIHPREEPEKYEKAFPDIEIMQSKVPLELLILSARKERTIVSIYSSAGMGFEQFCRRISLIKNSESENMKSVFDSWRADTNLLDSRIQAQLFGV